MDNSTFSHSSSVQPAGSSEQAPSGASATHWPAVDSARASLGRARTAAHEAVDRLASGASGWVDRIEGRKIFTKGTSHIGDTLCAEAEAVFLSMPTEMMDKLRKGRDLSGPAQHQ